MVKRYYLIVSCILLIFLIYNINAAQESLGNFRQNDCVNLIQTCSNCTSNNITSVLYPNSTQALGLESMTKTNSVYNYTFCYTSALGIYTINGLGDSNGVDEIWVYDFEITPTGNVLNTSQGILYIFMLIVMLLIFAFTLYAAVVIPYQNNRNSYDEIIQVNWKKYLKMFAGGISYVSLVWIVYLAWNLSYGYLQMRGVGTFFKYIFTLMIGLSLPVFASIVILFTVSFINDKKIQSFINKGIPTG
jgi:hypothetical protein